MPKTKPIKPCVDCGEPKQKVARGLCRECFDRAKELMTRAKEQAKLLASMPKVTAQDLARYPNYRVLTVAQVIEEQARERAPEP